MASVMMVCMTVPAQCDEVIRSVGASVLPLDDVVDLKLFPCSAVPAFESVTGLHVCLDVLIAQLLSLLVLYSFDPRIPDLLDVEGCSLDDYPRDRQNRTDIIDDVLMRPDLRLHRRSEPTLGALPVVEAGRAVSQT